jgi:rRNA maturation endonuclease Nob1
MSKIKVKCPRCQHIFKEEKADIYECPKCGTNIRRKRKDSDDFDKTQIFET